MYIQATLPRVKPAYYLFHWKLRSVTKGQCVQTPVEEIKGFATSKWPAVASNCKKYNTGVTSLP